MRGPPRTRGQSRECALVVDHQSPRERGESRASRYIIASASLFLRASCLQAYASAKRPLGPTPLSLYFQLNPTYSYLRIVSLAQSPPPLFLFLEWGFYSDRCLTPELAGSFPIGFFGCSY